MLTHDIHSKYFFLILTTLHYRIDVIESIETGYVAMGIIPVSGINTLRKKFQILHLLYAH